MYGSTSGSRYSNLLYVTPYLGPVPAVMTGTCSGRPYDLLLLGVIAGRPFLHSSSSQ